MIHGSCLCGTVRFEIDGPFAEIHHCHCSMCRKMHGAPFSTFGQVEGAHLRITSGESAITRYRSSPAIERSFCSRCGSKLFFRVDAFADLAWVSIGALDDDPGGRTTAHIFVASKAAWHEITDDLPQFDEYMPF